jgi:acetyl esterase/lipase
MEIRKTMTPTSHKGVPLGPETEKEYIYFTVTYNHYRDVSTSQEVVMRDREEMQECECVLSLPASYTDDGDETPLILSFHGSGHRVCEKENMIGGICSVFQCVDAGYAALDVNGSELHGRTIGCFEHLMAAYKAYRYAIKHFNLSKQVLVAGASMGGQTAVNFINMFPNIVTAVGLFYPRLNLDPVEVDGETCIGSWDKVKFQSDVGYTQRQRIAQIHRFPSEEWCPENVIGFNSYHIRSFINRDGEKVVMPPCPIKIWHGTADPTVDYRISVEYIRSIRRSGCYAELRLLDGVLHRTNNVMRQELLYWFNRFV